MRMRILTPQQRDRTGGALRQNTCSAPSHFKWKPMYLGTSFSRQKRLKLRKKNCFSTFIQHLCARLGALCSSWSLFVGLQWSSVATRPRDSGGDSSLFPRMLLGLKDDGCRLCVWLGEPPPTAFQTEVLSQRRQNNGNLGQRLSFLGE